MADDSREPKIKLPKINRKRILKRARKVENATAKHAHKFIIKRWDKAIEARRSIITWIVAVCVLIGATAIQLIWFQNSYTTTVSSDNGTYAEGVLGAINTLNPLYASTSAEESASKLLFSRLANYDKTGHLSYDLATDISVDSTNKIYTVTMRRDAYWSDGQRLTANDVVYTIGLIKSSAARTNISGWDSIGVKKIDDYTVEFTLNNVYAAFEYALDFPIVPEHILSATADSAIRESNFSKTPVTSGPFKLSFTQIVDNANSRKIINMIKNDNYYGGSVKLSRFQLLTYSSAEDILKALNSKEINAAADLSPSDIKNIDSDKFTIINSSVMSGMYALINVRSTTMSDKNIREALRYATDTVSLRDEIGTNANSLDLPFLNGQLSGDIPSVPGFNKEQAVAILESAGWKLNSDGKREKDGTVLSISAITIKGSEYEEILDILANQWRQVGIDVKTQVVDPDDATQNVAQSILQPRNYDVFVYNLDIGVDPDVYAFWHSTQTSSSGLNLSNYANAISDAALASARVRTETDIRNAKYLTFARQWVSDIPAIGLYQATAQYVYNNSSVSTYSSDSVLVSAFDRYYNVVDWAAGEETVYKTP